VDYKKTLSKIAEKWPAKVLSVAVAILLFAFHRMGDLQERFFSVPLQFDMNGTLIPAGSYPRNIRITLRGDANSIYHVAEEDIEVRLDLAKYSEPGLYKVPVQLNRKGTAAEAETLEIGLEPMEISLELDTKISKYVPLAPDLRGSPERGYELVSYTLEPSRMVLDGPLNLINGVEELSTETIDLESRNADFFLHLTVVNPSPLLVIRGDGMTEFRGFVRESIMIRSFDGIPISVAGLSADLATSETGFGSLRLEGAQRLIEVFEPSKDMLSVDASEITEAGTYVLPVRASVPEAFTLSRQEPLEITLRIVEADAGAGDR
jgi:hypothetical protein